MERRWALDDFVRAEILWQKDSGNFSASIFLPSIQADELIRVEEGAAEGGEAVGSRERSGITLLIDGR